MARLFGTDGVRGVANVDLTGDLAFKLGQAAVVFQGKTILIGKDTRLSGDMLESCVAAGVMSMGGNVLLAGVIPTPGVALLVRDLYCDGGVVISASHNPPEYNGIKLFDKNGFKLTDEIEDAIEAFVAGGGACSTDLVYGDAVGVTFYVEDACERYIQHALSTVVCDGIDFSGYKVALDVGHGASCETSAEALRRLGAEVVVINDTYDGLDINVGCGSTHLEPLVNLVREVGADVGIAHDGDADRVMIVDGAGRVLDGDVMEAVCALDLKSRDALPGNTVVSTVMCNLGFVHAMDEAGIGLIQAQVGDRYVLQEMREGGFVLGGEQSGHMIFLEHNSTGDGLVSALQFLAACKRSGKTVEEAAQVMNKFPQTLINVRVSDKQALAKNDSVNQAICDAEEELGNNGRILVRPSGTEPVVRVMVEAACEQDAERYAKAIASVIEREV